ncbi:flavin reductase family protein [Goodfellowiella coeruleoviolacea]|uniref:NADH-FMN oxidoreductase RutF, flavin reductase (DIM6/NTAB) family n=1 Tax=Goodfellowiella coeruleoviolacea TaxID=334858 RepID=A0AAE3GI19_9PSEU|nr:flavin reductase family protein [Goodfellowiella coeruleoviolacea]MCP2167805.1 NADH-FMN oxidoreductase RutF, flavin reductase (DIM6/NTAB) family [Goodfellowiella coeruleoviolacea]
MSLRTTGVGSAAFKLAARTFATGVAVICTRRGDELFAKTVSSFTTVSLDPPLVLVCVGAASPLVDAVRSSGRFAVSVLGRGQRQVSQHFATPGRGRAVGSFAAVGTSTVVTGAPVVDGSIGYFDCALDADLRGGDHQMLLGQVLAAHGGPGDPLVYHDGDYRRIGPGDGPH